MEENKKKSLLPLIIVLTLVLALSVGGVYAYFSARATNSGSQITGQTLDINGSTLTIAATRLDLEPDPAPVSDNLVPAYYGVEPEEMTTTAVNRALSKACVVGGYTGCHVWKIEATTTQNIPNASILLHLNVNEVYDQDEWSYVVYTGTDSSSTTILNSGSITTDFHNNETIDIHNNGTLTTSGATYYVMVYLNNENSAQNDGVTSNTTDARGAYNGTVTLEAMGGEVYVSFLPTAAEYITNLYTSAEKTTATVNNITYNLAPSANLMNDRHASMDTDINGGDIRYYGANPSNYVWLGDTYASSYSYGSGSNSVTRNVGDKKLWRIIGVFDGKVKLVSNDPINTQGLVWDVSESTVNNGEGINQWGPSGNYGGADLMKLLNPGYENNQGLDHNNELVTLNNSLYWNKGTGSVYAWNRSNATMTTISVNFSDTGLSTEEKKMIDTAVWYLGASSQSSAYVDAHYNSERGGIGKMCTQGTSKCNDVVTRTNSWTGKVGLIYASDYGYAADLNECTSKLNSYSSTMSNNLRCKDSDWLHKKTTILTISPYASSVSATQVFFVDSTGYLGYISASNVRVYPAIYLKSSIVLAGGTGTESDPYVLVY